MCAGVGNVSALKYSNFWSFNGVIYFYGGGFCEGRMTVMHVQTNIQPIFG